MVQKTTRNIVIAFFVVIAATIALQVVQPGGFSVTGSSGGLYARDDGNEAQFRNEDSVRCSDPMECEPSNFNPSQQGCSVVDVDSLSTAAEELGIDAYFALTQENSLTEINGVVYACQ